MAIPFINAKPQKNSDGTYTVKVYHHHGVVSEVHFGNAAFAEKLARQYTDFMNDNAEEIRKWEAYMKEPVTYVDPTPEELRAQAISFAMNNANLDREAKGEEPIAQEVFEKAYDELHPAEAPVQTFVGADISMTKDESTFSIMKGAVEDGKFEKLGETATFTVTEEQPTEAVQGLGQEPQEESKADVVPEEYRGEEANEVPEDMPIGSSPATDVEGPQETTTEVPVTEENPATEAPAPKKAKRGR